MEALFIACLAGGILFAVVSVIFGDWLSVALDGALDFLSLENHQWLQPTALVGAITVFGGAGLLLYRYSSFAAWTIIVLSVLIGIVAGAGVYFLYIRPMEQSENSTAYSMKDLSGALAEVLVPIPATGYGEVLVKVGAGHTNQIAASYEAVAIADGARVVVVEIKDGVLLVSPVEI
ncbi:protease [Paenibacillus sp. GCM10027626]|uniref:protease n=1 Tax=Paenibacillus sp. GCM10027626 TaxID=3273411 RepID=UPI0036352AB3